MNGINGCRSAIGQAGIFMLSKNIVLTFIQI